MMETYEIMRDLLMILMAAGSPVRLWDPRYTFDVIPLKDRP
jgi:hypothetical protein